jgi:hypothetical protein
MYTDDNSFAATLCIALILACAIICAGCISPATPAKSTPVPTTTIPTPVPTTVQVPVTTEVPVTNVTTVITENLTTASLSNGVTITYPADWQKEELSQLGLRDYGQTTLNIANFYSPDITADRIASAGPNPDNSTYTTLSIDVDPTPVTDFEHYFNMVTLALQNTYGHIEITKHNTQLYISTTDTSTGYKSYRMDFDTGNMRGSYIFTNVDGTIYIFAFKNPSPYSSEVQDMYKSIVITPSGSATKHR